MRAADGQPGVKAKIKVKGKEITSFLYNGKLVETDDDFSYLKPGEVVARRGDDVYISTKDGVITIGHMRTPKSYKIKRSLKLPSVLHLKDVKEEIPEISGDIANISYQKKGRYGIVKFNCYNGAAGRRDCDDLQRKIEDANLDADIRAIIISTPQSNGIHLNIIENSSHPSTEAFNNLLAINSTVKSIIRSTDIMTVSLVEGGAGAGGVFLALASDFVFVKPGVVLNPHYKNMGLYGSELHTYTENAIDIGLVDDLQEEFLNVGFRSSKKGNFASTMVEDFVCQYTAIAEIELVFI